MPTSGELTPETVSSFGSLFKDKLENLTVPSIAAASDVTEANKMSIESFAASVGSSVRGTQSAHTAKDSDSKDGDVTNITSDPAFVALVRAAKRGAASSDPARAALVRRDDVAADV